MKRSIIALLLVGCAADNEPTPPIISDPVILVPQRPAPYEDTRKEPGPTCRIIRTVWGGNCRLDEYKCADGSYRLDGKCFPSWELPHKNDPDPPF